MFGNNPKGSDFHSLRNKEQTEVRECLLSFGAESLVFQFAIQNENIKIYRTIIVHVVLYECETWLLTLRKECRLSVFENRVLRRILGPKRDEVTGEWRRPLLSPIRATSLPISFLI